MTAGDFRPIRRASLGLLVAGGVIILAGLFLMLIGLAFLSTAVLATLITGAMLVVAGVVADVRGVGMMFSSRQTGIGVASVVAVLLAAIALILVNYVSYRHSVKFDWTDKHQWTISPRVKEIMKNLDRKVAATVVYAPRRYGMFDSDNADITKRVLQQFADISPNFTFEYVDLRTSPRSWELVQKKLALKEEDVPCVVFSSGDRKEVVSFDSIYSVEQPQDQNAPYKRSYKGETRFASEILTLEGRMMPRLYFTTGHDELAIDKDLTEMVEQLRTNFLESKPCPNLALNPVPDDCAALVIVRPNVAFSPAEVQRITKYLTEKKGSLYVGVDPTAKSGLEGLLAGYGIEFDKDIVVDNGNVLIEATPEPYNEITKDLQNIGMVFVTVRSINILPLPPGPTGTSGSPAEPLLKASKTAYGETDMDAIMEGVSKFDPTADIKRTTGLTLAASFEQSPQKLPYGPPPAPVEGRKTRLVVVGRGPYMLATRISQFEVMPAERGNIEFFLKSIKWLAQTEDQVQLAPLNLETPMMDKLANDEETQGALFWVLVFGVPTALFVTGGIVWLFRRA